MADIQFGLMMRAQFPQGDDMQVRFREMLEIFDYARVCVEVVKLGQAAMSTATEQLRSFEALLQETCGRPSSVEERDMVRIWLTLSN